MTDNDRVALHRAAGMDEDAATKMARVDEYYERRREGMSEDDARRATWPTKDGHNG